MARKVVRKSDIMRKYKPTPKTTSLRTNRVNTVPFQLTTAVKPSVKKGKKKTVKKQEKTVQKVTKGKKTVVKKGKITKVKTTTVKSVAKKGNDRLVPRNFVKEYKENPFNAGPLPDFVSVKTYHRWLTRAIQSKNAKEMKEIFASQKLSACSFSRTFSFNIDSSPDVDIFATGDITFMETYFKLKKKYESGTPATEEPNLLQKRMTGHGSFYMIGRATKGVEMTRGGKEGNNALLMYEHSKDFDDIDLLTYLIEQNFSYKDIVKIINNKDLSHMFDKHELHSKVVVAARVGHKDLAFSLADSDSRYNFNDLHRYTLSGKNAPERILPASVLKKGFSNRNITPLHTAAINNDTKILEKLRVVDPNIDVPDMDNWHTIHYAAVCDGSAPLKYLLKHGISINCLTKKQESPLHVAVKAGRKENVQIILKTLLDAEKGATEVMKAEKTLFNARTRYGMTPLLLAVTYNKVDIVKELLDCDRVLPDFPSSTGTLKKTPLMLACARGYLDIAKLLVAKKALVEATDQKKRTPLIYSILNGQVHTTSFLLKLGAHIEKGDSSGNTAAHYAAAYGFLDSLKLLANTQVTEGNPPSCLNKENDWKITPLSVAYLKGHFGIVDWLIDGEHKDMIDINGRDDEGATLLSTLVRSIDPSDSKDVFKQLTYLIEKGADPSLVDSYGNTVLHIFCMKEIQLKDEHLIKDEDKKKMSLKDYKKCFELLLNEAPSALNTSNHEGETLLHLAIGRSNIHLVNILLKQFTDLKFVFTEQWSRDKTIIHDLLCFPLEVWIKKNGENNIERRDYDVSSFLVELLIAKHRQEVIECLTKKNKEGRQPLPEFMFKLRQCSHNSKIPDQQRVNFCKYVSSLLECVLELCPKMVLHKEEPKPEASEGADLQSSIIHSSLEVPLELGSFVILESLLREAEKHKWLKEVLAITYRNENLINHSLTVSKDATKTILKFSKDNNCTDGVHNAIHYTLNCDNKQQKKTLFMRIVEMKLFDLIPHLVLSKQDYEQLDHDGNSIWHYVAMSNDIRTVDILKTLEEKNVARKVNSFGQTALHKAVEHCEGGANSLLDPIEWLTVKFNAFDVDKFGRTALHYAFFNSSYLNNNLNFPSKKDPISLVSVLTANAEPKDVNIKDINGYAALHLAALRDANICAVSLIRKGSQVDITDNKGNTPLALATLHGCQSVSLTLIQADASVTAKVKKSQLQKKTEEVDKEEIWKWIALETDKVDTSDVINDSTVIEQIVNKGTQWEAMVYVLLDALGKNKSSRIQIIDCCLKEKQYVLANQLLKSLETVLDGKPIDQSTDLILSFAKYFNEPTLSSDSISGVVLDRLFAIGCKLVENDRCPALEAAIRNSTWQLVQFIITKIPASTLSSLKSCEEHGGPMKYLLLTMQINVIEDHKKLLKQLIAIPTLNVRSSVYALPLPKSLRGYNLDGPFTAVGWASLHGYTHLLPVLQSLDFDCNGQDLKGRTPIMLATAANSIQSIHFLCEGQLLIPSKPVKNTPQVTRHVFGQMGFKIASKRARSSSYASGDDDDDDESSQGDDSSQESTNSDDETNNNTENLDDLYEPALKKMKLKNTKLDLELTDVENNNVLHYLCDPVGWENVSLFQSFHRMDQSSIKSILHQKNKIGQTPLELAKEKGQRNLQLAMEKVQGIRSYQTTASAEVFLSEVRNKVEKKIYDCSADSTAFIDAFTQSKEAKEKEKVVDDRTPCVLSTYNASGVLVECPETKQKMSVLLNKTDISYGRFGFHNFYRMELIKRRDTELYILFTNWGRIGQGDGEFQTTPFSSLEAGIKEFKSVYRSKTGQDWALLDNFQELPKKYKLVKVKKSIRTLTDLELPSVVVDKNEKDVVRRLIADISHVGTLKKYLSSSSPRRRGMFNQNTVQCSSPFGRVSAESIVKANQLLDQCIELRSEMEKIFNNPALADSEVIASMKEINELSSQFYELVHPGDYSTAMLPKLDTDESIKSAKLLLRKMEEIEVSTRFLSGAARRKDVDTIKYIRNVLECSIEPLSCSDSISQRILQWIHNTSNGSSPKVKCIVKVTPLSASENFAPFIDEPNQMYLFHGTKAVNLLSILHDGLRVDPIFAQYTGRLYGEGVYLSDSFAKSANYCQSSQDNVNYMLICQVAVGSITSEKYIDFDKPIEKKVCDTLLVRGKNESSGSINVEGISMPLSPLVEKHEHDYRMGNYSEFIVRDGHRVLPRFIVFFKN